MHPVFRGLNFALTFTILTFFTRAATETKNSPDRLGLTEGMNGYHNKEMSMNLISKKISNHCECLARDLDIKSIKKNYNCHDGRCKFSEFW
jgi:Holliday junction resolvasome RuvABC ATP-dependent DNA helicase subunit